jgi:hypothetical protein
MLVIAQEKKIEIDIKIFYYTTLLIHIQTMATETRNIMQICVGDMVNISWKVKNDDEESYEWYNAIVKKIHRMEGTRYLVCTVEYDDGTVDKSHIFWEKDYGSCWKFADDDVDDDSSVDCVVDDNFNNDPNWNWAPEWEDQNEEKEKEENAPKVVYIEPRNNLAYDIDNLSKQLNSIRCSVRAISVMYFVTHLPLWVFVYMKIYESVVEMI